MTADDVKQRLAADFVAGLIDGDFDRMRSALRADATWTVPGVTAISGIADGAEAVVERARSINASDVTIHFERFLFGLDNVAVLLHNTGRRGDVVLDEQVLIVFTLRAEHIAATENLISDVAGLDRFFAAPEPS